MKKLFTFILAISFLFIPTSVAHAFDNFGTFTASNVHYNATTHELSFHAAGFSQSVTDANNIGITSCNTGGCAVDSTEFYGYLNSDQSLVSIADPYDFDKTLTTGSFRPTGCTVYVEFSDAGNSYQRMYSQALNLNDITGTNTCLSSDLGTFTASNVQYNPTTHELSFHAAGFSQPVTDANNIGISSCNTAGCPGDSTEFYGYLHSDQSLVSITDPYDFDNLLNSTNSYRPSSGTVYVDFRDAGNTYQRMYSQALNYDDIVVNTPPMVGTVTITPSPTHINTVTTVNAAFTDVDTSDTHTATINWGDSSGTQSATVTESGGSGTATGTHTYTSFGTYTVTVTVTDNKGASAHNSASVTVVKQLTALTPAQVYIKRGLPTIKLDLKAEVYKDSTLVSSGELDSVAPGGITLESIPFATFSPVDFPAGSSLKVIVYARNACTGSILNSGTATLSYNNTSVDSKLGATIGTTSSTYHLRDGFILGTSAGSSTKTIDVAAGAKCSAFKSFGTWTVTP